jgi:hypothetical protein
MVSQVFGNSELKTEAHQELDVHREQRFNVEALRETVKVLLASHLVQARRLHKEQVLRRVHLHLETMVVNSIAAVQADHDDKMTLERYGEK